MESQKNSLGLIFPSPSPSSSPWSWYLPSKPLESVPPLPLLKILSHKLSDKHCDWLYHCHRYLARTMANWSRLLRMRRAIINSWPSNLLYTLLLLKLIWCTTIWLPDILVTISIFIILPNHYPNLHHHCASATRQLVGYMQTLCMRKRGWGWLMRAIRENYTTISKL